MRVFLSGGLLVENNSGLMRYTYNLATGLNGRSGVELIVGLPENCPQGFFSQFSTIKLPPLRHCDTWHRRLDIDRIYLQIKPDIFHIPYFKVPGSFRGQAPLVITLHDLIMRQTISPGEWLKGRFGIRMLTTGAAVGAITEPRLARRVSRWITVSRDSARVGRKFLGIDENRITVAHIPVAKEFIDTPRSEISPVPDGSSYWVYYGGMTVRKNIGRLLKAYGDLDINPKPELVLIGRGGWADRGRKMAPPGARFLGYLPNEELIRWLDFASGMVYPSLYEGYGLPPGEALARGLPVMSSDLPSIREQNLPEERMVWCDPWSIDSIREGLGRLAGLSRGPAIITGPSLQQHTEWTISAYRSVLKEK